jgi:DNA replication and repair protein RecF
MRFIKVGVANLRNISAATLKPGKCINLVVGPNASGKTSLLEAMDLLCSGRSFRERNPDRIMQIGQSTMNISGQVCRKDGVEIRVAMERSQGRTRCRYNKQPVKNASDLSRKLPTIAIRPESHSLISGGPKERRRFLDRSLFHVEQQYFEIWTRYHRALRQRNRALSDSRQDMDVWDRQLASLALELDYIRGRHVERLWVKAVEHYGDFLPSAVSLDYYPGWRRSVEYAQQLRDDRAGDREQGFTRHGPHRADLIFKHGGREATTILSRGQAKLLIAAIMLSQARLLMDLGAWPVLLLDDLFSELDQPACDRLLTSLDAMNLQTFITATAEERVVPDGEFRVFHVERGQVS